MHKNADFEKFNKLIRQFNWEESLRYYRGTTITHYILLQVTKTLLGYYNFHLTSHWHLNKTVL
jgi:hypothetical protein